MVIMSHTSMFIKRGDASPIEVIKTSEETADLAKEKLEKAKKEAETAEKTEKN